tara:strand:+ start:1998 stop:2507 length:510 start_codon:yes stop_codon:yes gene_type:complete
LVKLGAATESGGSATRPTEWKIKITSQREHSLYSYSKDNEVTVGQMHRHEWVRSHRPFISARGPIDTRRRGRACQRDRWIAWLTGSKNALKGVDFFAGGAGFSVIGVYRLCCDDLDLTTAGRTAESLPLSAVKLHQMCGLQTKKPRRLHHRGFCYNRKALCRPRGLLRH